MNLTLFVKKDMEGMERGTIYLSEPNESVTELVFVITDMNGVFQEVVCECIEWLQTLYPDSVLGDFDEFDGIGRPLARLQLPNGDVYNVILCNVN